MKSKKFALIGTSCIGKTTNIYELERILKKIYKKKKIEVVPEAARYYFKDRNARKPFSYINQRNIQNIAKYFEIDAEKRKSDIILCDRSVFDAVAYVKTNGTEVEVWKLLNRVKEWLKTYSHFFLLDPKGIEYRADSIRKEDKRLREAFHVSFLNLLEQMSLPYTLISGNKEQRLKQMTKIILSFGI